MDLLVVGDVEVRVTGRVDARVEADSETVVEGTRTPGLDVLVMTSCARESGRNAVKYSHVTKDHVAELMLVKPYCLPANFIFTIRVQLLIK